MTNLNKQVFGKIITKEIIGAFPAIQDIRNLLENEFQKLLNDLDSQTRDDLKKMLNEQQASNRYINSRPGAMALAQDKIRLFTEYNKKYIQTINEKMKNLNLP